MYAKLKAYPQYARRIGKIRSKTVEPVLGTLINFTNMHRLNSRGMAQANKHVLMAALTYNLKKYLKFERKAMKSGAMALSKKGHWLQHALFSTLLRLFYPHLAMDLR